jgi:bifunctional non-homologous end joining protein LigD
MARASLETYRQRRDFNRTPEPPGAPSAGRSGPLLFVAQQHAARRLHYDFRLELDGVLRSWPIPKGPSYDPTEKRLAVQTENHPLDYATFEGEIPRGQYGAGQVIVWDAGLYGAEIDGQPCFDRPEAEQHLRRGLERGKLSLVLHGRKLRGGWTLVRKQGNEWLFLKQEDAFADPEREVLVEDASVLSGLTLDDLKAGRRPDPTPFEALIPSAVGLREARRRGVPLSLAPMLPTPTRRAFSHPDWLFEPKLDGYRVLAHLGAGRIRLISRRGLEVTDRYPWLVDELARQPLDGAVLDGEIVALDEDGRPSFQSLQNLVADQAARLHYYVFDLVQLDGFDLRGVPLEQRRRLLDARLARSEQVRPVEPFPHDGETIYAAALANGLEGMVAKRRDSRYEAGRRSSCWLKVKSVLTDELVIGGYTRGTGARARTFGALLLGTVDPASGKLSYVGQVGSGFDDSLLDELRGRLEGLRAERSPFNGPLPSGGRWGNRRKGEPTWVRPELVAEVKFAEWTRDGLLRAPVFLRLREDKAPSEVRLVELAEPPAPPTTAHFADHGSADSQQTLLVESEQVVEQLQMKGDKLVVEVAGHQVALSNLDKVFWPAQADQPALTKRDLAIYLATVAPFLLPHLRDRPLTLVRYPNGISGPHFYQRHPEQPPPFVRTVRLHSDQRGDAEHLLCSNLATLLWLAQIADLELHSWYSRVTAEGDAAGLPTSFDGSPAGIEASVLNYPDFVVFDLDPYLYSGSERPGAEPELHRAGFERACEAALLLKEQLDQLKLSSFVKTTGRTGLHVYVPITRRLPYDATHAIAETLTRHLASLHPERLTTEWAVKRRTGKLFLDYNQNARGKTLASIYSPRVLPSAAVSMPLRWDELGKVYPTDFTILSAPERLRAVGDLWAGILESKQDLGGLLAGEAA